MKTNLYMAYGSNLSMEAMAHRCPRAVPYGTSRIRDMKLVFRHVADVTDAPGLSVPVGVWKITPQCERALDGYEGVKGGLYRKIYVTLPGHGPVLVYKMNDNGIMPPSRFYLDIIRQGYEDFGLDVTYLDAAVHHATAKVRVTPEVLNRRAKRMKKDSRNSALAWADQGEW